MNGFEITFYTQQDRHHAGKPLAEWLLSLAAELGLPGATVLAASAGTGPDHRVHMARFFELADQPLAVVMVATPEGADRLFARLEGEDLALFYVKSPVEFGRLGTATHAQ